MGICASSQSPSAIRSNGFKEIRSGPSDSIAEGIKRLSNSVKVVNASDGGLQEYKSPVKARHVTSKHNNTGCYLGSSENMLVGTCVPRVPDGEDLSPAHIYFLIPGAQAQKPISLHDLCSLAIKASLVVRNESTAIDFSSSNNRKLTKVR